VVAVPEAGGRVGGVAADSKVGKEGRLSAGLSLVAPHCTQHQNKRTLFTTAPVCVHKRRLGQHLPSHNRLPAMQGGCCHLAPALHLHSTLQGLNNKGKGGDAQPPHTSCTVRPYECTCVCGSS
jgi:hypothetical protein